MSDYQSTIEKLCAEIAEKHTQILDEFGKAYIAANCEKLTPEYIKVFINSVALYQKYEGNNFVMWFGPKPEVDADQRTNAPARKGAQNE